MTFCGVTPWLHDGSIWCTQHTGFVLTLITASLFMYVSVCVSVCVCACVSYLTATSEWGGGGRGRISRFSRYLSVAGVAKQRGLHFHTVFAPKCWVKSDSWKTCSCHLSAQQGSWFSVLTLIKWKEAFGDMTNTPKLICISGILRANHVQLASSVVCVGGLRYFL